MTEDRYTNTPEDAAAFERRRAIDAGEYEHPDPSEYADDFACMYCGAPLLRDEGPACLRCEPDGSALVETLVCLAGMAVWLWVAFYCANAFGAWLAGGG